MLLFLIDFLQIEEIKQGGGCEVDFFVIFWLILDTRGPACGVPEDIRNRAKGLPARTANKALEGSGMWKL